MGCIMFIGHPGGPLHLSQTYFQIPPQGIPRNIVGIHSPIIRPQGGLHGFWGFSGFSIYSIQDTPRGTRMGYDQKIFIYTFLKLCSPLGFPYVSLGETKKFLENPLDSFQGFQGCPLVFYRIFFGSHLIGPRVQREFVPQSNTC